MARSLTPEEVKAENLARLPPELGELYHVISNELSTLRLNWEQFLTLFTSKETIAVLSSTADTFFDVFFRTLRRDVLLGIARLTDDARFHDRENVSLPLLVERALPHLPPEARAEVARAVEKVLELSAQIRPLRNRRLAHGDLATVLDRVPEPLPGISRFQISDILDAMGALLNAIEMPLLGSTVLYTEVIHSGGADALLAALGMAIEHEQCLRRRHGAA